MSPASRSSRPWLIHYFQRHSEDDAATAVPAMDFLDSLPPSVEAEFGAVLEAIAAAPPPAFSGGGKWEAMHGDMAGMYEVRISSSAANHRLFCCWYARRSSWGVPALSVSAA